MTLAELEWIKERRRPYCQQTPPRAPDHIEDKQEPRGPAMPIAVGPFDPTEELQT